MILNSDIEVRTKSKLDSFSKYILFGAGNSLSDTLQVLSKDKVIAVIDNDQKKWGKTLENYIISCPDDKLKSISHDTAIIFSCISWQNEIAMALIEKYELNKDQIFSFTSEFAEKYMYSHELILENAERIQKILNLLQDAESKKCYLNCIKGKLSRNPLYFTQNPRIIGNYEYRCDDEKMIRPLTGDCILDCGAYIGDTALMFKSMMKEGTIICLEPFAGNYQVLSNWANENNTPKLSIKTYNCAVGDCDELVCISANTEVSVGASVGSSANNYNQIQVRKIDDILNGLSVQYIKMDIEGDEVKALIGAAESIQKYHPKMMISAYHRTEHLWEIPEKLLEIDNSCKIFFGHQPGAPFEPEFYIQY